MSSVSFARRSRAWRLRPRGGRAWGKARWLPLFACPFAFGAVAAIFPLHKLTSLAAVLAGCAAVVLAGRFAASARRSGSLGAGAALLALILSLPFWSLGPRDELVAPAKPIYSINEARANPQAFFAWWTFFVQEVLRTNALIHMPDPLGVLSHVLKPGASTPFYKGSIRINELGYRGDDFPREKGGVYRLLTLGESTTFGQTLFPDSAPWSQVLAKLIDDTLVCDRPIQVINGGVNAYALRGGTERLKRDRDWLDPDMVLTYFGFNGVGDMGVDVSRWFPFAAIPELRFSEEASRIEVAKWFLRQTFRKLYSYFSALYGSLNLWLRPPDEERLMDDARRGRYHANYEDLIAETQGRRLVFLSFNTAIGPYDPEEVARFYESAFYMARPSAFLLLLHNRMLKELAQEHADRVSFVDTSAGIAGRYDEDIFLDLVHFTTKGDALMAANVMRGIEPLLRNDKTLNCRNKRFPPGQ